MMGRSTLFIVVLCVAEVGIQSGCGKVSRKDYEKLREGMSLSEVEQILGQGSKRTDNTIEMPNGTIIRLSDEMAREGVYEIYVWEGNGKSISAMFIHDKLASASDVGLR